MDGSVMNQDSGSPEVRGHQRGGGGGVTYHRNRKCLGRLKKQNLRSRVQSALTRRHVSAGSDAGSSCLHRF